jgi:DNA-directed RNA polymerase specialized sigma24 family protein
MTEGKKSASEAELRSAIEALTNADLARLELWGRTLLNIYGPFAEGREPSDVYQEALARTWDRRRVWNPTQCTFAQHIMGAMRSIASHFPEKYQRDVRQVPISASQLCNEEGDDDGYNPYENVASNESSVVEQVIARKALDRVEGLLAHDEEAFNVLVLTSQGKTESEVARELGVPRARVHAAMERIRYRINKAEG